MCFVYVNVCIVLGQTCANLILGGIVFNAAFTFFHWGHGDVRLFNNAEMQGMLQHFLHFRTGTSLSLAVPMGCWHGLQQISYPRFPSARSTHCIMQLQNGSKWTIALETNFYLVLQKIKIHYLLVVLYSTWELSFMQ